MAQNDIIDLDKLIAERASQKTLDFVNNPNLFYEFQRSPAYIPLADTQEDRDFEISKLKQYGFDPTLNQKPPMGVMGGVGYNPPSYSDARINFDQLSGTDQQRYQDAVMDALKSGDPYFMNRQFTDRLSGENLGELYGIDYENNVPYGTTFDYANIPNTVLNDPKQAIPTLDRLLRVKFRENEIELPEDYDFDIKRDPSGTVAYTFQNPFDNGKRTPINPPGLQLQEAGAFMEQLTYEILGGGGVLLAKSIAEGSKRGPRGLPSGLLSAGNLAVIAEGLAGFYIKYERLEDLKERGILGADVNILHEAMKEMGLVMGFGLGANAVIGGIQNIGKVIPGLGRTGLLPGAIDEDEFVKAFEFVDKELKDNNFVNVGTLTSPQVMRKYQEYVEQQGGPRLVSAVESAQKSLDDLAKQSETVGAPLREQRIRQEEAAAEQMDTLFEESAGLNLRDAMEESSDVALSRTGEELKVAGQEFVENTPEVIIARGNVDNFIATNSENFKNFLEGTTDMSPADIGRGIQEGFYNLKVARDIEVDEAFNKAFKVVSDKRKKPFDMSEVLDVFKSIEKSEGESLFPAELYGMSKAAVARIEGTDKITGKKFMSREAFDRSYSQVRGRLNEAYRVGDQDMIERLELVVDAFEKTRYDTLLREGGEQSTKLYDDAVEKYKVFKNQYKSGIINDITALSNNVTRTMSSDSITASNRLLRFINSGSTITEDGVISSPAFLRDILIDPKNSNLAEKLRLAAKNNLYENIFELKNGRVVPKENGAQLLDTWKSDNKSVLDPANGIFSTNELSKFDNIDQLVNSYNKQLQSEEFLLDLARKEQDLPEITKSNINEPEKWFMDIFTAKNVKKPEKLYNIITRADNIAGDTVLMDRVKLTMYDDFMKKTSKIENGVPVFDSKLIDDYINDHGYAMGIYLGDDFVANLSKLNNDLKLIRPSDASMALQPEQGFFKAINQILRAYVGLFTRPGRMLTAINYFNIAKKNKRTVELMKNPTKMYDILMSGKKIKSEEANYARRVLGYMLGETIFQPDVGLTGGPEGAVDQSDLLRQDIENKRNEALIKQLEGIESGIKLKYGF